MTVQDELFEIQYRIAKHELKKLENIRQSRTENKNKMLKEKTTLTEEDTKHLDEEMDFLDEQISLQKEIIKLYEVNYQ